MNFFVKLLFNLKTIWRILAIVLYFIIFTFNICCKIN